jgi:uncharacterized protein (TIGR04255 family)
MTPFAPTPDPSEGHFEHLTRAPIIEAVIEIRARAEGEWNESRVRDVLGDDVPDFPSLQAISRGSLQFQLGIGEQPGSSEPAVQPAVEHGWIGIRARSENGLQIATFTRDAFSFSRLRPYTDWDRFKSEMMRVWAIHKRLAEVSEVHRVGVRFINRLDVPRAGLRYSDYFQGLPEVPASLVPGGFLYRETLQEPDQPRFVNLVRTVQPADTPQSDDVALLLDIDAFISEPCPPHTHILEERLTDLQRLKNRVFFAVMTETALELCR